MIFQQYRGHLLVVRQPDHGVQTGLFASHWGNEETPPFTPREPVIAAGTRHDDGWQAWEEEHPTLDPSTGHPWQFYTLTPHEHVPLYRRGIAMAAQHDPTTGLLVSMHGAGLYNDRYGTFRLAERQFSPAEQVLVDEFLAEQALFQQSLAERALGRQLHTHVTTDPQVWYNYLLLQVWDRLSLQYAFRLAADGDIAPLPRPDGTSAALHCRHHRRPVPQARPVSVRAVAVHVPAPGTPLTGPAVPQRRSVPGRHGAGRGDGVRVPGEPRLSVERWASGVPGSRTRAMRGGICYHRNAEMGCP